MRYRPHDLGRFACAAVIGTRPHPLKNCADNMNATIGPTIPVSTPSSMPAHPVMARVTPSRVIATTSSASPAGSRSMCRPSPASPPTPSPRPMSAASAPCGPSHGLSVQYSPFRQSPRRGTTTIPARVGRRAPRRSDHVRGERRQICSALPCPFRYDAYQPYPYKP